MQPFHFAFNFIGINGAWLVYLNELCRCYCCSCCFFSPPNEKQIFKSSATEIKFAWTLLKMMNTQRPFHFNAISCRRTCATWREIMWRQTKSWDDTKVRMKIKRGEQKYGRDREGNERRGRGRGECIRSVLSSHCDRSIIYEVCVCVC